jgi:hypothetical protein
VRVSVEKDVLVFSVAASAGGAGEMEDDPATGARKRKKGKTAK